MTYEDILYEVRGATAWITINRPDPPRGSRSTARTR